MAPVRKRGEVFVANTSGATEIKGELFVFTKGETRVRAGHALLKAVPDYFEPVEEHVHYDTQAAAEPAETRG